MKDYSHHMSMPTIGQVIFRIALIITVAEFTTMMLLSYASVRLDDVEEALIDVILLSVVSIPLIYFLVIKPFVTARDAALQQINHLANTDPLTELFNRRHLMEHLQRTISSCSRNKFIGALILLDLDGFKPVNDTYGHDAGDALLIAIAEKFIASVRTEEVVCRMGGDEFVVLINYLDTSEEEARNKVSSIAGKLIAEASKPYEYKGHPLEVSASIGICLIRSDQIPAETIMHHADIALYKAKDEGKGRAEFFD